MGEGLTVLRVGNAGGVSGADIIDVNDIGQALTTLEECSVDGVFLPADRVRPDVGILRDHHPNLPIVAVGETGQTRDGEQREHALRTAREGEALTTLTEVLAERDAESALREHRGLRRAVGRIAADTAASEDASSVLEGALDTLLATDRFQFGVSVDGRDGGSVLEFPGSDAVAFECTEVPAEIDEALSGTETVVIRDSDPPGIVVPSGGSHGLVLFTEDSSPPGPGERRVLDDLGTLLRSRQREAGTDATEDGPNESEETADSTAETPSESAAEPSEQPAATDDGSTTQQESDVLVEMLAHDLRSPLDLGRGRLEMAIEEGDEEDVERAIETFDRIEDVVSAGVALARLQPGEEETVDIADRARSVWDDTATTGAALEIDDEASLPPITADPSLLDRLLSNLFRNAVEHGVGKQRASTDGGEGASTGLTVRLGPLEEDVGFLLSDDGEGIDPSDRERILDPGVSLSEEGTGYGLAIVDRVATAHGWDVSVEESRDGGARFEIRTA